MQPQVFPSQNPTDRPCLWPRARMCQNSHFDHNHPKNKQCLNNLHSYQYFSLARNVPDNVTPCFHWPWIFVICWCIMVSPDPPLHSLTHRCLHYWTGPGKLDSAGKSLILLPVIPTFVFLHHSWHTNCPLPRPALLLPEPQKEEVYGTPQLDIEPYIWTRKCKSLIFLMLLYPLCFSTLLPILPPHSDSREGMEHYKTSNTWTRKYLPTQEANTDKN